MRFRKEYPNTIKKENSKEKRLEKIIFLRKLTTCFSKIFSFHSLLK